MSLFIPKPYLNLTDIKRCKFCWYFTEAKHLRDFGGCKLHETMVKTDYKCNQWMEPTGEIRIDERAYDPPKNKIMPR